MSIPQTPSPLSNILAAKTYNAAWFSGSTKEAQITAAITAAVKDGGLYVYVPANMLPYTSSNVTFNSTVRMLCEGGNPDAFDIRAYGCSVDGIIDDRTPLNTLVNSLMPTGGRLSIIGTPRIGSNLTIPSNVEIDFVGNSYLAPDVNVTVTLSNFIRTQRKIFGGLGQVVFTAGYVHEALPIWFGAVLDGVADDTVPFISAIKSMPSGACVVQFVGKMRVTNAVNISAAINNVKSFCLEGRNGFTWRGNNSPPQPMPSIVYVNGLTDYFFKKSGAINESWTCRNVGFDGSNGTGTAGGTLTCPGIYASNGFNASYVECINVAVSDFLYAHNTTIGLGNTGRAIFDLDFCTWASFLDCSFGYCQNGRLFYTDNGAAQFHCRRCEITAFREGYYHRNSGNVLYDGVVIEACIVGGASYKTNLTHRNPWWESVGVTGGPLYGTGLAPRNHGLAYGAGVLDGNVNCYISALGGFTVIENAQIQAFAVGATILAWLECLGTVNGAGPINGGYLYLSGKKASADTLLATTMAYGTAQRNANMQVEIWDRWDIVSATGVGFFIYDSTPARYCDMGAGHFQMNDGVTFNFMRIYRGCLIGDVQNGGFSTAPTAVQYPKGDQWRTDDRINFSQGAGIGPSQTTGVGGIRCYLAGTAAPGWVIENIVHATGVDVGDNSLVVNIFLQQENIMYNTPITAPRTVTLPNPNTLPTNTSGRGLKYRVIRTALCLGAFPINIQRSDTTLLKALPVAGMYADFEWSTLVNNWILTGSGFIGNQFTDTSTALTWGATPAIDASQGMYFTLNATSNIAAVVAVPTNFPPAGYSQEITCAIRNSSGGALATAVTFNGAANGFKSNGGVSPGNGTQIEVKFRWDPVQSFWYEVTRGVAL